MHTCTKTQKPKLKNLHTSSYKNVEVPFSLGHMGLHSTHKFSICVDILLAASTKSYSGWRQFLCLLFITCHSRKFFSYRCVDSNGRRDITAALPTSGYSFCTSIQNWLNNFSLKLYWNQWLDFISIRCSSLFADEFALVNASILSCEQIQSVLPSETLVNKGK
jgi:hypothetical protein